AVKRKGCPSKLVVAPVNSARAEVCAIEENLEPRSRLDLSLFRRICVRRLLLRRCWNDGAENQYSDDGETIHSIHSYASCGLTTMGVLRGQTAGVLALKSIKYA